MPATAEQYRAVLLRGRHDLRERRPADGPPSLTDAQIELMVERYAAEPARRFAKADPTPIRPRRRDEREYERRLRRLVLDPLFRNLRSGLTAAGSAALAIAILDNMPLPDLGDIPEAEAARQMARLNAWHRERLVSAFRAALGVDIRPLLLESGIREAMESAIAENVNLVRTIPPRAHDGLRARLQRELMDAPFDQARLSRLLREEYGSSGYNLRRLTRDQTGKVIGQLTELRHRQVGIAEYIWRTAADERVRPGHAALDGTQRRYGEGIRPGEEIQCRCIAIPVIPEAIRG